MSIMHYWIRHNYLKDGIELFKMRVFSSLHSIVKTDQINSNLTMLMVHILNLSRCHPEELSKRITLLH